MPAAAQIREHYDSLAFIYRTFWGDHIHHGLFVDGDSPARAQVRLIEYCLDLLGNAGSNVLDVGCGHGATAVHLAREHESHVLGITISEKQAQMARQNVARAGVSHLVSITTEDAETFAYPPNGFDLVWTMESSEHFFDKQAYFRNVGRSLRSGGQLLLSAWTGSMQDGHVSEVARRFLCPELWTSKQYRKMIEAAGLQISKCQDLSESVTRTWEICRQRALSAGPALRLLPSAARDFVNGFDIILDAYRSQELRYTVIAAEKAS